MVSIAQSACTCSFANSSIRSLGLRVTSDEFASSCRFRSACRQREEEREQVTTLKDIPVGSSCTVKALTGVGAVKRRIMDMGITKGAKVKVVKVAPLGDPLELNVRGYELSIRKDEAEKVEVEPE